ncbi:MAG TPA: carbon monoxide dehydrogenase subunit G [Thermomicrobiales bacterium]|jgi:carbon monoxide dehydrogenase subunit G
MHFTGSLRIPQSREEVWDALTDPQAIGACVPDVEQLDAIDETHFRAVVRAGIGPVRGKFAFDVTWHDLDRPGHAGMSARGKTMGSAVTVESTMDLTETAEGGTALAWSAEVVVHGMLAGVGARLLNGFAEKQTQQFFGCISSRLETGSRLGGRPA